jgi:hypothetical protein
VELSRSDCFLDRFLRFSESDTRKCRELSTSECRGFGGQQSSTGTFYQAILVSKDEYRDAVGRRKQMEENLIAQWSQQEAVDKLWLPHLVLEEALRNLSIRLASQTKQTRVEVTIILALGKICRGCKSAQITPFDSNV